ETEHMLVLTYDLAQGYSEQRGREFNRRALERVTSVPYVESAALASNPPFSVFLTRTVFGEGHESVSGQKGPTINVNNVNPEYFRTVSIPVVKGRDFTPFDGENSA